MATVEGDQGRIAGDGASVVIGEPRPLMRVGLSRCLTEHGFLVQAEGVDATETVALALAKPPAICLLAVNLPGGAITAVVAIRSATPGARIVILAEHESVTEALEYIRLGAAGYLSKDIAPQSLPRALHSVVRGEVAVSRAMTRRLLAEARALPPSVMAAHGADRPGALTVREHQVLQLLSHGASTAEIARSLSISPVTARRHRAEIRRKLG
jgi:DNA-binding NarL/FixJ family response regulator